MRIRVTVYCGLYSSHGLKANSLSVNDHSLERYFRYARDLRKSLETHCKRRQQLLNNRLLDAVKGVCHTKPTVAPRLSTLGQLFILQKHFQSTYCHAAFSNTARGL